MKPETEAKGQQQSQPLSEKAKPTFTSIQRPRPVRRLQRSALITRNSNTSRSPSTSQKASDDSDKQPLCKSEKAETSQNVAVLQSDKKLPDYLALIYNFLWFPYHCIVKFYRGICFVISLPGKAVDFTKYLASRPGVYAAKASKVIEDNKAQFFLWLKDNIEGFVNLCVDYHVGSLIVLAFAFWLCPLPNMTYPLFSLLRLVLGTLYPAYASYKAVRTKNVREYVKWMMYWIVFAIFTSIETFTDIFVAFWFPFYYEVKILFLIWLISPVSKGSLGSSILYRRFVHPTLINREEEIDQFILKLQEQGYNTVTKLAIQAFNYVSNVVMQTAIRGGGGLVHQLRKSYSLTDLGNDESDFGGPELRAITNDTDEIRELERRRRTGSTSRANTSGQVRYVRHISSDEAAHAQIRRRTTSHSRDSPSPTTVLYRDRTGARPSRPGRESYPSSMYTSSKTLPRPKSLVFGAAEDHEMRKYKSVVTLKSDHPSYHYRNSVHSAKSTSPTHRAVMRRRLSQSEATFGLTSEYFSYSSESETA